MRVTLTPSLFAMRQKSEPGSHLARRMIAALIVCGGRWVTRREMRERFGLSDRECRLGRAAAHGRIIYGQAGYRLLKDATPDEIRRCLSVTCAMINSLQREYRALARRAHGVLAGREQSK